jgi:3-methyl-2-oxobutanoate hydroxymethyltransferase
MQKDETRLVAEARLLEKSGVFALVLESMPERIAQRITEEISLPTIGIGAGNFCDGQILVYHDLLGINPKVPNFVKKYDDFFTRGLQAIETYAREVRDGDFPEKKKTSKAKPSS